MAFCSGKSKAVVAVTSNGETIKYIIANPPVDVTLIQKHVSVVTGQGLNLNNCGGLNNYGFTTYDGYVEMVGVTVGGCSGVKPSVDGVLTPGTDNVYYPPTASVSHSPGEWELTITNTSGLAHRIRYPSKPMYKVSCDDECPEGFCRCEIPEYPGYCCLDCAATSGNIRAITNDLRAKNGR
jgi:hypothetical protein